MSMGPLTGFTIGVTADRRADEQIKLLAGRGASCIHGPVIKTHPLDSDEALRLATVEVIDNPPDVVVLTTGIGVRSWLEAADALHLGDGLHEVLHHAELVARGPKAVGALVTAGFEPRRDRPTGRYDDVIDILAERGVSGDRVAVQLDGGAATDLCQRISDLGAELVAVPVYRWTDPDDSLAAERLIQAACEGRIDGLTFTARPAVERFLALAEAMDVDAELERMLRSRITSFCVGPVCAAGFTDVGLPAPLVPERSRLGAMVQQVTGHFSTQSVDLVLAGVPVRYQGRAVSVESEVQPLLSDRERSLLDILMEKPGVVHHKKSLLERVWGDSESDEHVVEVTVGRLRQRLGEAGPGIETVIKRGYRLSVDQ